MFWAPEIARAQPSSAAQPAADEARAEDEVRLRNGGFVTGRIVEFVPGSHVVIRSAAGNDLRFEAADVTEVRRGGESLDLTGPAPAAAPSTARSTSGAARPDAKRGGEKGRDEAQNELQQELTAVEGPRVTLKLRSNVPAQLQRRIGAFASEEASAYHIVCRLPCTATLPVHDPQPYRVGAIPHQPTSWFSPPRENSALDAELVKKHWGLWAPSLAVMGTVLSVVGTTLFILLRTDTLEGDAWKWTGLGFSIAGGASYASAIGFWAFQPESQYELHPL